MDSDKSSHTIANPLPNLFIGDWVIVKRVAEKPKKASEARCLNSDTYADIKRIRISPASKSATTTEADELKTRFKVKLFERLRKGNADHTFRMTFDAANQNLIHRDEEPEICISYWRNPAFDTLSISFIKGKGPSRVWGARRIGQAEPCSQTVIDTLTEGKWAIRLVAGHHGAPNKPVQIRRLSAGDIEIREEQQLFGLFEVEKATLNRSPKEPISTPESKETSTLYDILTFDARSCSFNSVFGMRTLNYWPDLKGQIKQIFATFNNRFSLPRARFAEGNQQMLGAALPIETKAIELAATAKNLRENGGILSNTTKEEINKALNACIFAEGRYDCLETDDAEDDPDVAVWVGTPLLSTDHKSKHAPQQRRQDALADSNAATASSR